MRSLSSRRVSPATTREKLSRKGPDGGPTTRSVPAGPDGPAPFAVAVLAPDRRPVTPRVQAFVPKETTAPKPNRLCYGGALDRLAFASLLSPAVSEAPARPLRRLRQDSYP